MMSMTDPVAINIETLMIDSGCSLEKFFTALIHTNSWMILFWTIYEVDSCHSYVFVLRHEIIKTCHDCVLTMTYESLATKSLKCHRLNMV